MIPMQWSANVKLPYYGWFGRDGFSCEAEARDYVADKLRSARRDHPPCFRPSYSGRTYIIAPRLLLG